MMEYIAEKILVAPVQVKGCLDPSDHYMERPRIS